jgi:hypothetical protein
MIDPLTLGMFGGSALSGLGSLFGSRTQAGAASSAGQMGLIGSILAAQAAEQGYQRASAALSPYSTAGTKSMDLLMSYLQGDAAQKAGIGGGGASLISTFAPTMEQLEQTPGYQFAREQGLGATAGTYAGKGMGKSGMATRGAAEYATGLASTTFQQQLQNYLEQNKLAYNMLFQPTQLGAGAAQSLAGAATSAGQLIGNAAMAGGTSLGQGIMGAGNALAAGTQAGFGALGQAAMTPYYAQFAGRRAESPAAAQGTSSFGIPSFLTSLFGGGQGSNPLNLTGATASNPYAMF